MPFQSEAQRRFMHAKHPQIARRWEAEEKSGNYRRRRGNKVADNSFAAAVDRRRFRNRRKSTPSGMTPMPSGRAIKTLPATRAPGTANPRATTLPSPRPTSSPAGGALQATLNRRLNKIRNRRVTTLPARQTQ